MYISLGYNFQTHIVTQKALDNSQMWLPCKSGPRTTPTREVVQLTQMNIKFGVTKVFQEDIGNVGQYDIQNIIPYRQDGISPTVMILG